MGESTEMRILRELKEIRSNVTKIGWMITLVILATLVRELIE